MTKAKLGQFRTQRLNANKHTPRGLGMLSESIGKDGWIGAVTVAADNETFDGSARLEVLADAMPSAEPIVVETDGTRPVIVRRTDIPNTDDARAKRLGIGANRIQQADLDFDADVLAALASDIDLTQFWNKDELAELLKSADGNDAEDPGAQVDKAAELQAKWGTALGQLWQIGRHRLLVGDCTVAENVARLMGEDKADMVFTDPPYGVDYDGGTKVREKLANDESTAIYGRFLSVLPFQDHTPLYMWFAHAKCEPVYAALREHGWVIRAVIIWNKNQAQFGALSAQYKEKKEPLIYAHRKGHAPQWFGPTNEVTVWDEDRSNANEYHPTQKPPELAERALRNSSKPDDVIVDMFVGGGSTLVACEKLGRSGRGMELSPAYAAVTLERLSGLGLTPELVG